METITMWAEISPKATNARQTVAPDTLVRNAILSTDAAKIRKDAQKAMHDDVKMHIEHQNRIDAAYMEAVESGDIELAKRLVREYAESQGGGDIDFNIVKSTFGKDVDSVLNWINKGYLTFVDKEKALGYLYPSAPIAETANDQELVSVANIVRNFENPKVVEDNYYVVDDPSLIGSIIYRRTNFERLFVWEAWLTRVWRLLIPIRSSIMAMEI